ncbi:hypothetical protein BDV95DRAFT_578561 [Massariosphaeria phaeospora]|uniref:Peptidase S54 rhomboid domain-containing protein n=1 Tax=Massariosphaeria phaeospora TaxID=100035 RepID=A0A7C8I4L5_9PLEO|nr:hypothetical protein BDV95DRAFT_578561 [Massariosphaeria phaeospora]
MSTVFRLTRTLRPASSFHRLATRPTMSGNLTSRDLDTLEEALRILRQGASSNGGQFPRFYRTSGHMASANMNMKLLWGVIGLNCGIWGYAFYVKQQAAQGYQKPAVQFWQNMTLNLNDALNGRPWQAITSVFTHQDPWHLICNMLSTYYFGRMLAMTPGIGPGHLLTLIIGSGLSGSAGYLYFRSQKAKKAIGGRDWNRSLGFSGAVMGIGAVAACMYPTRQMMIYGILPVPMWALISGYFVYDGIYLNSAETRVAHSGHMGGLAFGLVYYFARLRGVRL